MALKVREKKRRHDVMNDISDVINSGVCLQMALSTEMHRDIIKHFHESKSVVKVLRRMQKMYPEEKWLNRMQVHRIVRKFE